MVTDTLLSDASRNPWEQDTVEVYVDQNNAKTAYRNAVEKTAAKVIVNRLLHKAFSVAKRVSSSE